MTIIGGYLLVCLTVAAADNPPSPSNNDTIITIGNESIEDQLKGWTLQFSDPKREGRFFGDIPLTYGDWVPIDRAKALVEKVANRFAGHDSLVAPSPAVQQKQDQADDRVDSGEPVYVNSYQNQQRYKKQQQQRHYQRQPQQQHRHQQPQRQPQQSLQPPKQQRRQDVRFPGQSAQNNNNIRGNRKLPPPNIQQNNVYRGQPQKQSQSGFGFVPSLKPLQSFNPFKFFESAKPEQRPATFTTPRAQQQRKDQSNFNAIKTIAAPDLSKFGPPVIELDSGVDGEILLGQNYQFAGQDRDHLAGFVSLDFDGFTPGDRDDKKPKKQQEKEKLSILVGTNSDRRPNGESDLVNFFNNNADNTEAFVTNSKNQAPQGFTKFDLPFMDPTKHNGHLPKAFIAPKGIPIPKGYKGKPLKPEKIAIPAPSSWLEITTRRPVVLVTAAPEEVLKLQEVEDNVKPISLFDRRPSAFLRPKPTPQQIVIQTTETPTTTETPKASTHSLRFKLQKQARPSFHEYLRNKKKAEYREEEEKEFTRPEKKEPYRKPENTDRVYVNTKIQTARKDIASTEATTSTTATIHIPAEHRSNNVFKLVNDSIKPTKEIEVTTEDDTEALVNSFFAAGGNNAFLGPDVDDDTISIVYQPADDVATPATTTVFAPTVLPFQAETTTILEQTYPTTMETTTELEVITTTTMETTTELEVTTTTAAPAITTSTTPEPIQESTKRSKTTEDPLDKLEALRKIKQGIVKPKPAVYQGDLLSAEDVDESIAVVTEGSIFNFAKPFRNRFKLKKFKSLPGLKAQLEAKRAESGESGSPLPGFGKRIRSRKRPVFWNGRFGQGKVFGQGAGLVDGSVEPTARPFGPFKVRTVQRLVTSPTEAAAGDDAEVVVEKEEVKRKLRPFFDKLYEGLTQGEGGAGLKEGRRYGLPRRRSTTAAPPITVDAEIYEVHPKTRLRITTRKPTTTEKKTLTAEPTTTNLAQESSTYTDGSDYYTYQDDYVYEPTTEAVEISETTTEALEETTTRLYWPTPRATTVDERADQTTTETDDLSLIQSTTISQVISTTETPVTTDNVVHETADKHSTTTQIPEEAITEALETNEIDDGSVVKPVSEEELELLTLDIANEIVDQVYEESQQHETTFKGKVDNDNKHKLSSGRLTSYEKNIDTSRYGEDKYYNKDDLKDVVNEHGQQGITTEAREDAVKSGDWQAASQPKKAYHEINRNEGSQPIVSIEEIQITETKDYSEPDIIYDDSRDSFHDVSNEADDTFSMPVSVAFNVPDTTTTTPEATQPTTPEATQSTTEVIAPSTTTITEEPSTVAVTTERHYRHYNPTSNPRIYSLINRNKKHPLSTTTESPEVQEVFLGTTRRSSLDLSGAQTASPTTAEDLYYATEKAYQTAHRIPGKLWSAYEISRQGGKVHETTTEEIEIEPVPETAPHQPEELDEEISVDIEHEEINTEGFNLASIMSYSMPDENSNATALPGIVEIDDLPKPNEHQSQVLIIEEIPESATNDPTFHKLPKAIDFSEEKDQVQLIPLRQKDGKYAKKFEIKTKKREEWIKNWVDRKFNKPKFPRGPLLPLAPSVQSQQDTTTQKTTPEPEEEQSIFSDSVQNEPQHSLLVPTIPPKITSDVLNLAKIGAAEPTEQPKQANSRFNVNFDVTVRDGDENPLPVLSDLKSSLLEKYSSTRLKNKSKSKKNSLFHREEVKSSPVPSFNGVPRGANSDLFRSYAGKSLSQSDFERQILGVSSQTEISVKSMICVKGQCFNADDMGKFVSK